MVRTNTTITRGAATLWSLQREVAEFDAQRFRSLGPGYIALSLAGEAGELANLVKKLWRQLPEVALPEGYQAVPADARPAIADELADIVMLSLVLANHLGIDVEDELRRKLEVIDARLKTGYYGHDAAPGEPS
jgi:NTP pyrophosphatase (non-canonical NTP hydrolase)